MKITNKKGLPEAFVQAVKNQIYDGDSAKHDISVTQLISPPQILELRKIHEDEIEEDVTARLWSLFGQLIHDLLRQADTPTAITEHRLSSVDLGWIWSGKFDRLCLINNVLQEYKTTSVWEFVYGLRPDRVEQLNLQAELAIRHGYKVEQLEVVMWFRDFQKSKAQREPHYSRYPRDEAEVVHVPLWSQERRTAFLHKRIRLHQQARQGIIPECTPEDRWQGEPEFAVMREGRKTAIRVVKTRKEAEEIMQAEIQKGKHRARHYVEFRPAIPKRCADGYCPVADFCHQWAKDEINPKNIQPSEPLHALASAND